MLKARLRVYKQAVSSYYNPNLRIIHSQTMKVIIIALLLTYISAQAPVVAAPDMRRTADELCWSSVCESRWNAYTPAARRLQKVVTPMPTVTSGECQERCYDRCMCAKTRRLQAVVATGPSGSECNKKCNGGGKGRRLQAPVTWRAPSCPQVCFNDCYEDLLGQGLVPKTCRLKRRLQAVQTKEQNAAGACKTKCKITSPVVENAAALAHECQSACICRPIK